MSSSDGARRAAIASPHKGPNKPRFEAIFAEGRRVRGSLATVVALPGTGLVGIATAKKIGSKPERNRAKRRIREAIRLETHSPDLRFDFVIIVSVQGAAAPFVRIQEEIRTLLSLAVERWEENLESS
jgi:ribonuclease P protein component